MNGFHGHQLQLQMAVEQLLRGEIKRSEVSTLRGWESAKKLSLHNNITPEIPDLYIGFYIFNIAYS